ncbi:MAG: zinc-dependent metalloprotease, partial [Gemmatimonadales bacterium]
AARQRSAVQFLVAQVFATPTWLLDRNILDRIEHSGGLPRMRAVQVGRLNQLLDPQRMQRMVDTEARGPGAYTAAQMMGDVQNGVWSELPGSGVIDVYRRALQRGHVERLAWLVANQQNIAGGGFGLSTGVNVPQSDFPALARGQLADLRPLIRARITRTRDAVTRYHLQDILARIDTALDDAP